MPTLVCHPDEVRVLSRRFGQGAANIDKYIELDGYKAVQKAIAQGPEKMAGWIIDTMKACGLRGRGGAGFPTGMKWSFVPKTSEKPKYVLVNGDESEPGTCKDHVIFLEDPHAVIEGTMIAGLAIGSKLGFIYLRGEYRYLLKIVEKAVADAYAKGFLGKNIFGSGHRLRRHHADRRGSLRGRRRVGADGVARRQARRSSHQAALPCCRRPLRRPHRHQQRRDDRHRPAHSADGRRGLREARQRTQRRHAPLRHQRPCRAPRRLRTADGLQPQAAIYEVAGGIKDGKKLKAVVPGGASCPVLTADEIDVGLDFDQMGKAGTMLGSGGIVVLDETVSIVEFALRTIAFYQHESCGWCIPCREGTDWIKKTLTRVYNGGGSEEGRRQRAVPRRKHDGPDVLPARRRGRDADARLRQEIPQRV